MRTLARSLVALVAVIMSAQGLAFWFQTELMNGLFALSTINDLGFASIRADFGGFFLAVGLFSALAAWKCQGHWALAAAILFVIAFTGRVISLGFEGPVDGGVVPMVFEATAAAILLWARNLWAHE
ncbi:MAG: hypothetical protein K0U74_05030 [Alphaproteobacteria bacterium]|nr:hypothetical protein [Alphaproteobacteria bacterium]